MNWLRSLRVFTKLEEYPAQLGPCRTFQAVQVLFVTRYRYVCVSIEHATGKNTESLLFVLFYDVSARCLEI